MAGPLDGVTVLDLTRYLPGPFCSMVLGDFGARVLKIEPPGGDSLRRVPPEVNGMSALFASINRNKESVVLNLKKPEGAAALRDLAAEADVLLDGFRPGVLDRLECGHSRLRKENPELIVCALTGYGQEGPFRDRAGHDLNYLAYAGVLGLNGGPEGPPVPPGIPMADLSSALYAVIGVLLALRERDRNGEGQLVDVAMLDSAVSLLSIHAGAAFGGSMPRQGGGLLGGARPCYRVYETKDGRHLAVGALEPKFWAEICRRIGREDLLGAQFGGNPEAVEELEALFRSRTREEWCELLEDDETCVSPVLDVGEVLVHPQIQARDLLRTVDRPEKGAMAQLGPVPALSATPGRLSEPPPELGAHTETVLKEFGFDAERMSRLRESGAIG